MATNAWTYELRPSRDLPVVDLSVSVKSRFLSPRMLVVFSTMVSYRRSLFAGAVFTLVVGPICLAIDSRLGRPLSVVTALAVLPLAVVGVSLLRYEVVKLLLWTYDAQLFLGMSVTTLATCAALLRDARCMLPVVSLIGLLPNIFVDANLRAVQASTLLTGLHFISMGVSTLELMVDIVPDVQTDMALITYGAHALPAKMFVTNGMVTLTVLLLRNFYRKREAVFRRENPSLQHCVTYRARLQLCPDQTRVSSKLSIKRGATTDSNIGPSAGAGNAGTGNSLEAPAGRSSRATRLAPRIGLAPRVGPAVSNLPRPNGSNVKDAASEFVQQLRYDRSYWIIDARNTVWPAAFAFIVQPPTSTRQKLAAALFHALGSAAFVVSVLAFPVDRWLLTDEDSSAHGDGMPVTQCVALALTLVLVSWVLALAQRDLLRAVVLSFDFAYLSLHLVFLCWCMCDFFRWNCHSIMVFVVCLWLHCPMCIDALTPPVRARLGIHVRQLAALQALVALGSTAVASYLLVFDPVTSANVYDRVVWTAHVPGAAVVEVSIMPFFYSCILTAFLMMLRFLLRAATYGNDDLVAIDGPVVFSNCFHRRTIIAAATTTGDTEHPIEPRLPSLSRSPVVSAALPMASKRTRTL